MKDEIWVPGRVFVYGEECQVEYFYRFEKDPFDGTEKIRSVLREINLCRPLDYICKLKYLDILPSLVS